MSKIIIANWKMNLSIAKSVDFIKRLKRNQNQIVLAAPYTFLPQLSKNLNLKKYQLAAQDVSQYEQGAYTGEVSAKMLKELNCAYCVVGHSERRIYFQETDQMINQKIQQLLNVKIKPILCIGENFRQRKKKLTKRIIKAQLEICLKGVKDPHGLVLAYEPIWAISTFQKGKNKHSVNIKDILEVNKYLKNTITQKYKSKAKQVKITYGGSVNPENCQEILNQDLIEGALIGGASLKVSKFNDIIESIK